VIDLNISSIDESDIGVYVNTLKCRIVRVLMTALPPPGKPIADKKKMSMTCLNSNSFMSYHPL
jgi:hypothetical protein